MYHMFSRWCNLIISYEPVNPEHRLTSVNNNITTSHPRSVSLGTHEDSEISNLFRFGESVKSADNSYEW
jgi:hypothetical protein